MLLMGSALFLMFNGFVPQDQPLPSAHVQSFLENEVEESDRRVFDVEYPSVYSNTLLRSLTLDEPLYSSEDRWYFSDGSDLKFKDNTILFVNGENIGYFDYDDMRYNQGFGDDFTKMMGSLDANCVVRTGSDSTLSFFGHYYDLSGTGVFNRLVDDDLISDGSFLYVTDNNGLTKKYEFTQIESLLNNEQDYYYYGPNALSLLAYQGIGEEMALVQYCRWDIDYGRLILNFAHRVPLDIGDGDFKEIFELD